jgi:hypothetical protein
MISTSTKEGPAETRARGVGRGGKARVKQGHDCTCCDVHKFVFVFLSKRCRYFSFFMRLFVRCFGRARGGPPCAYDIHLQNETFSNKTCYPLARTLVARLRRTSHATLTVRTVVLISAVVAATTSSPACGMRQRAARHSNLARHARPPHGTVWTRYGHGTRRGMPPLGAPPGARES